MKCINSLALTAMLMAAPAVHAASITVAFDGEVRAILSDDSSGTFSSNFSVGDTVSGSWTFDSAATGTPLNPNATWYASSFEVTIGSHTFSGSSEYRVFDNASGGDGFSVINEDGTYITPPGLGPLESRTFFLQFLGMPTSTFSGQSLILDPNAISSLYDPLYAPSGLRLDNPDGSYGLLYFTAATSVPVPAAVWLFGSGILALAGMARRRKLD